MIMTISRKKLILILIIKLVILIVIVIVILLQLQVIPIVIGALGASHKTVVPTDSADSLTRISSHLEESSIHPSLVELGRW